MKDREACHDGTPKINLRCSISPARVPVAPVPQTPIPSTPIPPAQVPQAPMICPGHDFSQENRAGSSPTSSIPSWRTRDETHADGTFKVELPMKKPSITNLFVTASPVSKLPELYLDIETFSSLDLQKVGAWVYSHHCEVLLIAYAFGNEPARVWDRTASLAMPEDLRAALSSSCKVVIHHSQFDRWCLAHSLNITLALDRIVDTMVLAYACAMPGNLNQLGQAVQLEVDFKKMAAGKKLIHRFSKPAPTHHKADRYDRFTHPEEWQHFKTYAEQDIVAMREIYKRLPQHAMRDYEWRVWRLDQKINDRGFAIDRALVNAAITLDAQQLVTLTNRLHRVTCGAVQSAKQYARLAGWVRSQGIMCDSVAAPAIDKLLEKKLPAPVREALELCQQLNRSSIAKYARLADMSRHDGRVHGAFQYAGAGRTRRWAGRDVQPHNLPRALIKDTDTAAEIVLNNTVDLHYDSLAPVLVSCVRSAFTAGAGKKLRVSDFASIEGRVLAFLAGEQWKLDAYAKGQDLYVETYARSFGKAVQEVTRNDRQIGKVMELALGYEGGVSAFVSFAETFRIDLNTLVNPTMKQASQEQIDKAEWMWENHNPTTLPHDVFCACDIAKQAWRAAHPATVALWKNLKTAALLAIKNPGQVFIVGKLQLAVMDGYLMIKLPSNRHMFYHRPTLIKDTVHYWGTVAGGKWSRIATYGGKLTENATQAVARDLLADALLRVDDAGFDIVGHVHDEVIVETAGDADGLDALLCELPVWAKGLPVEAAGYLADRYRKD